MLSLIKKNTKKMFIKHYALFFESVKFLNVLKSNSLK